MDITSSLKLQLSVGLSGYESLPGKVLKAEATLFQPQDQAFLGS